MSQLGHSCPSRCPSYNPPYIGMSQLGHSCPSRCPSCYSPSYSGMSQLGHFGGYLIISIGYPTVYAMSQLGHLMFQNVPIGTSDPNILKSNLSNLEPQRHRLNLRRHSGLFPKSKPWWFRSAEIQTLVVEIQTLSGSIRSRYKLWWLRYKLWVVPFGRDTNYDD